MRSLLNQEAPHPLGRGSSLHILDSQAAQDSNTYSRRWLAEYEFDDWYEDSRNKEDDYKQIGWFYSARPSVGYAVFLYRSDGDAELDNGYIGKYIAMRVVGVADGEYEQYTLVGAGCAGAAGAYDTPEQAIAACEAEMGQGIIAEQESVDVSTLTLSKVISLT